MNNSHVRVIGGGLAGCEAAYQLSRRGIAVDLYEMKPDKKTPAHHSDTFAELVCSNSLRSDRIENAVGLLKQEMRMLGSLILSAADEARIPAGSALAVDRETFSQRITERICSDPRITVHHGEITAVQEDPCIIATGPLTSDALSDSIGTLTGQQLHFYDAAAPIVTYDSLDHSRIFRASRYGRGEDYLNCPMTREEYTAFYAALVSAETAPLHEFETPRVFEGCMPVEVMARRGDQTLLFGPLKPVGLKKECREALGFEPFAVVQLRQDRSDGSLWNLVGFQTNLKFPEQRRVFGLIPGLAHAEYARYGVMHRNTFLPSPGFLNWDFSVRERPLLFFAGQMTGVEGYVESAASGLLAGLEMAEKLSGRPPFDLTSRTAIGALGHYVSDYNGPDFQPMNITYGIMDSPGIRTRSKSERAEAIREESFRILKELQNNLQSGM